ncbi:anthranilate isomerase [Hesseltinella vesiculosa]|uniref:Multifunctional tryptophan biosynthesis protein n=1 Tax=Hesseltinella vesiculosa TaxID=101127 RepID=A0A1X2G963_9FUNG|nr:anthranilate isomerase [Hesseltinella vesiculosa]
MTTILIDNYDSFVYNVYQYLCSQGANVKVFRNDKITIDELEQLEPANIVISPGPGHPSHDSGISRDIIKHFGGKLPILGICMGLQCIFDVYGGTVSYAGDILHGKTSTIKHDNKGLFRNVPQDNQVTRYHSLAGMPDTMPPELETTATTDDGIIMGVRHKLYAIEGVQFHPESILCNNGHTMIANFLALKGGLWTDNPATGVQPKTIPKPVLSAADPEEAQPNSSSDTKPPPTTPSTATPNGVPTILQRIHTQRLQDIEAAKQVPGQSFEDLEKLISLHAAPPLKHLVQRMKEASPALMAEVKRASPSKGAIDIKANAAEQGLQYALAGASVISVLTEPKWFRGSLNDMRQVRQAVDHLAHRPCILRKDFIVDPYQILEARLYGADTILLIVAMLNDTELKDLYSFAVDLGMEPLVEVNNADEMARANALGAKVIGVNNRNLHSFDVDMDTTTRLASMVPEGTILCALSGIASRADVETYLKQGVQGLLVGEALMRAWNLPAFVQELIGRPPAQLHVASRALVKICGISTPEAAQAATEAGADFIGMIFVPKSRRCVDVATAKAIVDTVRKTAAQEPSEDDTEDTDIAVSDWFDVQRTLIEQRPRKPLVVGVFVNATVSHMIKVATQVGLDAIQLHGSEAVELARFLPLPVIKAFAVDSQTNVPRLLPSLAQPGYHHMVLLDAKVSSLPDDQQGGHGVAFDWSLAKQVVQHKKSPNGFPIILAGGLSSTNVATALHQVKPWVVDVSSGVETDGVKDLDKIREFISIVKTTSLQ